jgi:hypothetical protein
MKNLSTLLIGTSLALVPAVGLASPPMAQQTHLRTHSAISATTPTTPTVTDLQVAPKQTGDQGARASNISQDAARYASRDEAATDAKQYRGGDTVVIGASAAVAILAIVLLIVIL